MFIVIAGCKPTVFDKAHRNFSPIKAYEIYNQGHDDPEPWMNPTLL